MIEPRLREYTGMLLEAGVLTAEQHRAVVADLRRALDEEQAGFAAAAAERRRRWDALPGWLRLWYGSPWKMPD